MTQHEPRHSAPGPGRLRSAMIAIPVAVVGTIAVTLGAAAPAQAAPTQRNPTQKKQDRTGPSRAERQRTAAEAPAAYTVAEGDTVSGVAARFGLSTARVLALNGLSWSSLIFPGQRLVLAEEPVAVPAAASPPAALGIEHYTIRPGDTISGIAAAHGVTTAAVFSANGLGPQSIIYPGQTLTLPPSGAAEAASTAAAPASPLAAPPPASSAAPPLVPLDDETRANALAIVTVGREAGVDDDGLVVALTAAAAESGLRNLDHGDQDSLGLFQQRPSMGWGTPEQIMDARFAARSFFGGAGNPHPGLTRGLLDIPGWQGMTPAQAAQAVQLSGYPDAYTGWVASARAWLAELG